MPKLIVLCETTMHWQLKAALMDFFSVCPGGDRLRYWVQRNITKSLPRNERDFREKLGHAKSHLEALSGYANKAVSDRKSTRLNSSHANISYAVFCLKKKNKNVRL